MVIQKSSEKLQIPPISKDKFKKALDALASIKLPNEELATDAGIEGNKE